MKPMERACFVAGTLVLTATGLVAIEAIRAGDRVTAADEETLEVAERRVAETYVREVTRLVRLTVAGETISTTVDHPFYVSGRGFMAAGALLEGDVLVDAAGAVHPVEAIRQEATEGPVTVYNFQVEGFHTYHVGKAGILVHNAVYPPGEPLKDLKGITKNNTPSGFANDLESSGWVRSTGQGGTKSGPATILTDPKTGTQVRIMENPANGQPYFRVQASGGNYLGDGILPSNMTKQQAGALTHFLF